MQPDLFTNVEHEISKDHLHFYALSFYNNILGYKGIKIILNNFNNIEDFFNADRKKLEEIFLKYFEISPYNKIESFLSKESRKKAYDYAFHVLKTQKENGLNRKLYLKTDKDFPVELKELKFSVDWIFKYFKYFDDSEKAKTVAIVGTRNCSMKALDITKQIVNSLVKSGYIIVSGLAEGIDTEAHKTTIFNSGKTIAILGTGVKNIYPKNNYNLMKEILNNKGIVYTEYFPKFKGNRESFILRNRIIAALSNIVIAIEGKENSGTAYTIKYASELKKRIIGIDHSKENTINNLIKKLGGQIIRSTDIDFIINKSN